MFLLAPLVATALAQSPAPPEPEPVPPGPEAPASEAPAAEALPPLVREPALLEFVQAPYPTEAASAGIEGAVRLILDVDATGAVTNVEVAEPVGHGFDEAAIAAARAFRFSPAEDATGPIPVVLEFDYRFALAPEAPAAELPITVEGRLQEMATRYAIPSAAVQIYLDGTLLASTKTDESGAFSLRGIPPGTYELRAFDAQHRRETLALEVVEGQVTAVTLWLKRDTYREAGVIGVYEREKTPEVTRRTITIEEVRRVPGTFGDPVRIIQSLPGAARPPFGSGLLVLRGANPEDSNVYVDGVEVPLVYHLGGFRSIINASLIETVDYLPGTYSTAYGRSTGGVINVRSKSEVPDQTKIVWRSDFLDTGLFATGKVADKVGFSAGIRRSYLDAILGLVLKDSGFYAAPRWFDYQVKLQALDMGKDELSLFFFGFQDDLIVRTDADAADQLGLHYSTQRLIFRYTHALDDTLKLELQPALGVDGIRFGFGSAFRLELDTMVLNLRGSLAWAPSEALTVRVGLDSEASRSGFSLYAASVAVDGEDPLAETEPLLVEAGLWQVMPDPFTEAIWRPLKDPKRLSLVGGVRLSSVLRPGEADEAPVFAADPRFGARFDLFEGGTLKGGTGIYHQPPQGAEVANDPWFERAWSSELGWEQQITPVIRADVTGFYRQMDALAVGDTTDGIGRAYGLEVMLRHAPANRLFGWISYTLSKSERNDTPDDPEGWYPFEYDQTHILTAVAGYRLPLDLDLSTRLQYVTGNPYTPYDGGLFLMDEGGYIGFPSAATNSARMSDYYAWDLRIEKMFTYKFWQMSVFADVLNVIHGENPEFTLYNYDYTESATINGLPIFPSVGIQLEVNL